MLSSIKASDRHALSQRQWKLEKQSHTVEKIQDKSTLAQQQEKSRLSLNLSLFDVGPWVSLPQRSPEKLS